MSYGSVVALKRNSFRGTVGHSLLRGGGDANHASQWTLATFQCDISLSPRCNRAVV